MLVKRLLSMQKPSFWPKMLLAAFLAFLIGGFLLPRLALAQTQDFGLGYVQSWGIFGTANIFVFIGRLIQVFLGMLGVIASIIIMYSGFSWMFSQGDPAKIAKAKKILTNAIIGLIIIFMSFAIVTFVISMLSGAVMPGGGPGNYPGSPYDPYRSAIGRGPIESVFPAPNAVNIPINTWIAVTFKEAIDWDSVHATDTFGGVTSWIIKNIEICEISATSTNCLVPPATTFGKDSFASSTIILTDDLKTIIISPSQYLGNDVGATEKKEEVRAFKVKLLPGILNASKREIFGAGGFGYYEWAFKTNGQLDLDPPEIVSTNLNMLGVYPMPDDMIDSYANQDPAVKASASVTLTAMPLTNTSTRINDVPFNKKAEAPLVATTGNIPGGFKAVIKTDSGFDYSGTADVAVTMTVDSSGSTVTFAGGTVLGFESTPYDIISNTISTKIGLTFEGNGPFLQNSQWQFNVKGSRMGDTFAISSTPPYRFVFVDDSEKRETITVKETGGGTTVDVNYKTVKAGTTNNTAAYNLANAINVSQANYYVKAEATANVMTLTAAIAGVSNLAFSATSGTFNPASGQLTGGQNMQFGRIKSGNQDAYNNTIFQINFNEAVNPAFINNVTVKYDKDKNGSIVAVQGSTTLSNQYRTVEIRGPYECGVNSCGDKMYCWLDPAPSKYPKTDPQSIRITVEVGAASLKTCSGSDSWCTGSFGGVCEFTGTPPAGRCKKIVGTKNVYYPQANVGNVNGLIDMAGNSFNGSFNTTTISGKVTGIAEGQSTTTPANGGSNLGAFVQSTSTYPTPTAASGDNFAFTFYLSNEIDSYAPLLKNIDPYGDAEYVFSSAEDFSRPVWLAFDRLMSFSSLKPGWGYDSDKTSKAWNNRYLALATMSKGANPVGYWIGSGNIDEDGDHIGDYTRAGIEHNRFDRSVRYGPLAGSGALSITQNCFLPSRGPANAGNVSCRYDVNGSPDINCTTSTLPNPASYAKLKCTEIEGAKVCDATHTTCYALYYKYNDRNNDSPTSTKQFGSWVITSERDAPGAGGCCLGKCVDAATGEIQ